MRATAQEWVTTAIERAEEAREKAADRVMGQTAAGESFKESLPMLRDGYTAHVLVECLAVGIWLGYLSPTFAQAMLTATKMWLDTRKFAPLSDGEKETPCTEAA